MSRHALQHFAPALFWHPPASRALRMIEDVVSDTWLRRHKLPRPTAPGLYESDTAWIRVDCARRITHAARKDQTILCMLIARGTLDEQATWLASTFLDWKYAFLTPVDGGGRNTTHEANGSPLIVSKADRYVRLLKGMNPKQLRWIEMAVVQQPHEREVGGALANPQLFREAFDRLEDAIQRVSEWARDESDKLKNACASY